ncbi:MAG: DUF424 domain-containing protein [Candidatus Bathyarchaeia archaeon]
MEVYVKTMKHGRDIIVAVCDAELLGKTLQGDRVAFKVNERFYGGVQASIGEAIEAIRRSTISNLVGKKIVEAAIAHKIVNESAVIYFGDIPHTQIVIL